MKHFLLLIVCMGLPFMGISQLHENDNKPILDGLDEVATFSEGLAAVRKGNQWGFIDKTGKLAIPFRDDVVWNQNPDISKRGIEGIGHPQFIDGLCIIKELTVEEIPLYGFADINGKQVIKPEFVNITTFDNGYAIGIYARKTMRGKNEFQLDIYDYSFTEVIVNKQGEMIWPVQERTNIVMNKRRFKLPQLRTKILSDDLLAVMDMDNKWKVVKWNQ